VCRIKGRGRPRGSIGRHGAGHDKSHNHGDFKTNNEPNDYSNSFWNSVAHNYLNGEPDNDGFVLRYRSLFSGRHTCRRKRLHGWRPFYGYSLWNLERHFERYSQVTDAGRDALPSRASRRASNREF